MFFSYPFFDHDVLMHQRNISKQALDMILMDCLKNGGYRENKMKICTNT